MARRAVTIGFSVPPEVAKMVEEIAQREGKSKSQLFRDMLDAYRRDHALRTYEEHLAYGRKKAEELGVTSEEDVVRIVREFRREQQR